MDSYLQVLKKYAVFDGRAPRAEYWGFWLINVGAIVVFTVVLPILRIPPILTIVYSLAIILPSLAVQVRRLHDTSRSGWWLLLTFVPLGAFVLIIFLLMDSTPGHNKYGANPKGAMAVDSSRLEDRLRELDDLRQRGVISDQEYQKRRRAIISKV